nr:hypothetical protein [Tanacetum cinerariifolium]
MGLRTSIQEVEGYTEEIVHDFEQRLEMIFRRQVNRVYTLDFEGLTPDMRQDLAERIRMVYTEDDGQEIFVSHAWRRLFEIQATSGVYTRVLQHLQDRHARGRKSDARLSKGHFIGRLAHHFGLRLRRLEEETQGLRQDVRSLRRLVERSMTDHGRLSTWMVSFMTQLMEASRRTYQAFDGTFRGSYPTVFERRTRCRTDVASISITQQDVQQPDP